MSEKKCCVPGCLESGRSHPVLHGFPNPEKEQDRFNSWLMAIGGHVLGLNNDYIFRRRRVCHAHFDEKHCCRLNRISNIAVPTLNIPDPLKLPTSSVYLKERRPLTLIEQPIECSPFTSRENKLIERPNTCKRPIEHSYCTSKSESSLLEHNKPLAGTWDQDDTEVYDTMESEPESTQVYEEPISSMCRICLVDNVRMHVVSNRNLQEVYEKLTNIPFVTEDHRPMLACSFCYTKLKQCWQLQRKCLEAEEVFAQMLNEDYENTNCVTRYFDELMKTPTVHVSIGDICPEVSAAIIEELPDMNETQDDIEHQSDDPVSPEDIPSLSTLELDQPLFGEIPIGIEEREVPKKRKVSKTKDGVRSENVDISNPGTSDSTPTYHSEPEVALAIGNIQTEYSEAVPKKKQKSCQTLHQKFRSRRDPGPSYMRRSKPPLLNES